MQNQIKIKLTIFAINFGLPDVIKAWMTHVVTVRALVPMILISDLVLSLLPPDLIKLFEKHTCDFKPPPIKCFT
jgi:hypothetical protein